MKRLEVRFTREPGRERIVGQLAENRGQVFFEYAPDFLRSPLWLSPFKLPPQSGLIEHRDRAFGPLFGLSWRRPTISRFLQVPEGSTP